MRKIIFSLSIMLLFLPIVKADTLFGGWQKIESMIITFTRGNQYYSNYIYAFSMEDGKVVYCVEPFTEISFNEPYLEYGYNDSRFNISDEQLEKIKLIAYYGYNYPGHEDIKWYGITQFLIWKALDLDDIYFVNSKGGDRINAYEDEINELEKLVQNHNTLPSFIGETVNYKSNGNYIQIDTNYVLKNYRIKSSNIDSQIIGNELDITTEEDGSYYIEFERIRDLNNDYILYGVKDYQSLFYPGGIDNLTFRIDIEVNTGTITIEKRDSESIERSDATLEGAVYSIEKDGLEVDRISINSDGVAIVDNLDLGEYLVKEVRASTGYTLDKNIYYVNLTKENKTANVVSYEKVISGNLVINKYYGEGDNYKLEEDCVFNLYSNDELIKTYELTNGTVEDMLPYGKYYLEQEKGKDGYKLIDYYVFSIEENREYKINLYDDPIEKEIILIDYPKEEAIETVELKVDVPNTGAESKLKYCILLIFIGITIVIISFKYNMYNKK